MNTDRAIPSAQALFESLYGSAITEDGDLKRVLASAPLKQLSIGELISPQLLQQNEVLILLAGKVRVLGKLDFQASSQTVTSLAPGSICSAAQLNQPSLEFRVSSDDVLVCILPAECVMHNPILAEQAQSAFLDQPAQPAILLRPAEQHDDFSDISSSQESNGKNRTGKSREFFSDQAWNCIEAIETHYRRKRSDGEGSQYFQSRKNSGKDGIRRKLLTMSGFLKKLKSLQYQTRTHHATWTQLLNCQMPFLVRDPEGLLHWVTGRQGNILLETIEGNEQYFNPSDTNIQTTYETIFLRPLQKSQGIFGFKAFSLPWYFKLCTQNVVITTQMVLASILVQIFSLASPIFYMVIFDRVFGRQNLSTLDVMAMGIIVVLLFEGFVRWVRSWVMSYFLEHLDKLSLEAFVDKIFQLNVAKSMQYLSKGLAERLSEVSALNQVIVTTLLITSLDAVFSTLMVLFLMSLNMEMTLISLAPLIPLAMIYFWKGPHDKKAAGQFNANQRLSQFKLREALEHSESVHSLNIGSAIQEQLFEQLESTMHKGFGVRFGRVNEGTLQNIIMTAGGMATLYFGAKFVLQGQISYGAYMAINMLGRTVVGSIQRLLGSMIQFQQAVASLDQFKSLMAEEEQVEVSKTQGVILNIVRGQIEIKNLSFRYQPEAPVVLKEINLAIAAGEKVILTGKSGAGKTTLIRLLQRLYEPTSGNILLDGVNLLDINMDSLKRHVGIAPQKPAMFMGSIRENVALGNVFASERDVVEAISKAQLDNDLTRLSQGLDSNIMPQGANLSGGEMARISLARLFLLNPSVLILDEALAPCDPAIRMAVYNYIFNQYRQATCIFVSDDVTIHQHASKIVVLHNGQIVEVGNYAQLMEVKGYYFHLHHGRG